MNEIFKHRRVTAKMCTQASIVTRVLSQLQLCYESLKLDEPYERFLNGFMDLLESNKKMTDVSLITDHVNAAKELQPLALSRLRIQTAIKIAIYFAHRSNKAFVNDDHARSWYYATQATKWEGLSFGSEHAFFVRMESGTEMARAGGKTKAQTYEPIKIYARELATERQYPSRRNAALCIKTRVIEYAKNHGVGLSDQQAERTISSWLKDLLFASKRATSTSKGGR